MNPSHLLGWLRRRLARQPNLRRDTIRPRVLAPEWLEPRTVLSASGLAHFSAGAEAELLATQPATTAPLFGPVYAPFAAVYSLAASPGNPGDVFVPHPIPASPTSGWEAHYHHSSPTDVLPASSFTMIAAYVPSQTAPVFDAAFAASFVASTSRPVDFDSLLSSRPLDLALQTSFGTVVLPAFRVITDVGQFVVVNWSSLNGERPAPGRPSAGDREPPTYGQPNSAAGNLLADELAVSQGRGESALKSATLASLLPGTAADARDDRAGAVRLRLIDADNGVEAESAPGDTGEQSAENDGLVELDGLTGLRVRKSLSVARASQPAVSPQLARLAELPWLRDTQAALRELVQIARDAVFAAQTSLSAQAPSSAQAVQQPEDGMLELLAADVGTVSFTRIAAQASTASSASNGLPVGDSTITLDARYAVFQAFEVAEAEEATNQLPPVAAGGEVVAVQPSADQVARLE